ncbi:hypothetical protein CC80DRAFT_571383 [Byssothecium circinans]|uniref:Uncharacterized protein n=1 Tax=Byssothecium circinans TaxID=147558 RepID=A0A6A5TK00_9PLEO|nr:hypothetical protein CC80DRAFT_571383 [Byssothecium circinans]
MCDSGSFTPSDILPTRHSRGQGQDCHQPVSRQVPYEAEDRRVRTRVLYGSDVRLADSLGRNETLGRSPSLVRGYDTPHFSAPIRQTFDLATAIWKGRYAQYFQRPPFWCLDRIRIAAIERCVDARVGHASLERGRRPRQDGVGRYPPHSRERGAIGITWGQLHLPLSRIASMTAVVNANNNNHGSQQGGPSSTSSAVREPVTMQQPSRQSSVDPTAFEDDDLFLNLRPVHDRTPTPHPASQPCDERALDSMLFEDDDLFLQPSENHESPPFPSIPTEAHRLQSSRASRCPVRVGLCRLAKTLVQKKADRAAKEQNERRWLVIHGFDVECYANRTTAVPSRIPVGRRTPNGQPKSRMSVVASLSMGSTLAWRSTLMRMVNQTRNLYGDPATTYLEGHPGSDEVFRGTESLQPLHFKVRKSASGNDANALFKNTVADFPDIPDEISAYMEGRKAYMKALMNVMTGKPLHPGYLPVQGRSMADSTRMAGPGHSNCSSLKRKRRPGRESNNDDRRKCENWKPTSRHSWPSTAWSGCLRANPERKPGIGWLPAQARPDMDAFERGDIDSQAEAMNDYAQNVEEHGFSEENARFFCSPRNGPRRRKPQRLGIGQGARQDGWDSDLLCDLDESSTSTVRRSMTVGKDEDLPESMKPLIYLKR